MAEAEDAALQSFDENQKVSKHNVGSFEESDESEVFVDAKEEITAVDAGRAIYENRSSFFEEQETSFSSDFVETTQLNIQVDLRYQRADSCIDECEVHDGKIMKFFCKTCRNIGCSICNSLYHRDCKNVEYIPTFVTSSDCELEEGCTDFENKLKQVERKIIINKSKSSANRETVKCMKTTALQGVRKTRTQINELFDRLEDDIRNQIDALESQDMKTLDNIDKSVEQAEKTTQSIRSTYEKRLKLGHKSNIFTSLHLSTPIIRRICAELETLDAQNVVSKYVFETSEVVSNMINNVTELGTMTMVKSSTAQSLSKYKQTKLIKKSSDNLCKITGLAALKSGKLIITDCANCSIKIVDVEADEIVYAVQFQTEPLDVAIIDDATENLSVSASNISDSEGLRILKSTVEGSVAADETVAVTFPRENKVKIIDIKLNDPRMFSKERDLVVNGSCRGMAYERQRLFLTFPKKAKIEIIDMEGNLLKRITNETIGRVLFEPQFIAFGSMTGIFYVTDKNNHDVLCISCDGVFLNSCRHDDLIQPRGICTDKAGTVFVCSFSVGKLFMFSEKLEYVADFDVSREADTKLFPYSVAYSDHTRDLYCGKFLTECITIYKVT